LIAPTRVVPGTSSARTWPATVALLLSLASPASTQEAGLVGSGFDPELWRPLPAHQQQVIRQLAPGIARAMESRDAPGLAAQLDQLERSLGDFAGYPERRPEYGGPIDASAPDFRALSEAWAGSFSRMAGRQGWEGASPADADIQEGNRLRVTVRHVRAYLQSWEASLPDRDAYLRRAREGLDYLLTAQSERYGVFGYPYHPGGPGLKSSAASMVERAFRAGHPRDDVVENGWIVNVFNLGDGGLQFDNGMSGIALLYGYAATGDERYLRAAERAGEWAASQILVTNWNYNSFSGYLLSRLYRVTGEHRWLDAARIKMEIGTMPGQRANGRWIDPHNARIQYHSVMLRAMIEYWLARVQAGDSRADEVRGRIALGLDNLAEQINRFGASNAHEALALDALSLGLIALGPYADWRRAADITVNYIVGGMKPRLEERGLPLTETLASYLLYRRFDSGATDLPAELSPGLRAAR